MRLWGSILAVWFGFTLVAAPSRAEDPALTIEVGDGLRAKGELAAALDLYKALRARAPSLAVALRVAETEDALGQIAAAHGDYTDLLVDYYGELDAKTLDRVGNRLSELDGKIGVVRVEDIPDGTTVAVDGVRVATTPLARPMLVSRGEHQIAFDCQGYERLMRTVSVGADAITVAGPMVQVVQVNAGSVEIGAKVAPEALAIAPLPADITLDGQSVDTELVLDGAIAGRGRYNGRLVSGRHTVVFRRAGYREQTVAFTAEAGKTLTVLPPRPFVALAPLSPPRAVTDQVSRGSSEPPPPPPEEDAAADDNSGFFGSVILPVQFGSSTNAWNDSCPTPATLTYTDSTTGASFSQTVDGSCSASNPIGGGLNLRMGYNFGWFGIEAAGVAVFDASKAEIAMDQPPPGIPSAYGDLAGTTVYVRPGVGFGLGGRLSTPGSGLRATFGADFGFVKRWVFVAPSGYVGSSQSYTAPLLMLDGGIQLGSVPGGRLYLGGQFWWEFSSDVTLDRDMSFLGVDNAQVPEAFRRVTPFRGTQFFFGPFIGVAFGY